MRAGPKGSTAGSKEGVAVLCLLLNSLYLKMLDVFGMGLLGWVGFGRQMACQTWASLISTIQWASISQMVQAQRVFTSLMASAVSDSIWWRTMPKLETCFLHLASREDLVNIKWPRNLLASSWSWATSMEGAPPLGPEVSTKGEEETCISANVGLSISASSGVLTWEEVSTSLAESSGLRGSGVAMARNPGLFGVELPDPMPEVSRAAQDRSSLTSIVILIWTSALGGSLGGAAGRSRAQNTT